MRYLTTRRHVAPFSAAAALLCALVVDASGFALLEQSASRLGTAFSGTGVAADDATIVYFNPARTWIAVGPRWEPAPLIVLDFDIVSAQLIYRF